MWLRFSFLVVVMVDTADRWTCNMLDLEVLKCLAQHPDIPAILVLNKVSLMLFFLLFFWLKVKLH